MYLDESSVKKALSLSSLLEVLSDVLDRYSKHDPSLKQPLRSILPIGDQQKYKKKGNFFLFIIYNRIFSSLLNLPCIDVHRGYMCVKTITSFPGSSPAIDGAVSLFNSNNGHLLLV